MIFIGRYSFKVERKNEKFSRDVKFYECHKIVKYEKRSSNFCSFYSQIIPLWQHLNLNQLKFELTSDSRHLK